MRPDSLLARCAGEQDTMGRSTHKHMSFRDNREADGHRRRKIAKKDKKKLTPPGFDPGTYGLQ